MSDRIVNSCGDALSGREWLDLMNAYHTHRIRSAGLLFGQCVQAAKAQRRAAGRR
jgi:hypothetical protein